MNLMRSIINFNLLYSNRCQEKTKECFKYHNILGVPMIRDKKEWSQRLTNLKEKINLWINKIPEKEITNEYLFYNKLN